MVRRDAITRLPQPDRMRLRAFEASGCCSSKGWISSFGVAVVVPSTSYGKRASAFMAELTRKAHDQLPPDQARELVADIDEHLATFGRGDDADLDEIFRRLGTPDDLVLEALGARESAQNPDSRTSRIRNARTITPEVVALSLLYLGAAGADYGSVAIYLRFGSTPTLFIAGLLGLLALPMIVAGSVLIWLSSTPKQVEKWVAVTSAILFPLVLAFVAPKLPGRFESCYGGSSGGPGQPTISYNFCRNGPNWVTHTVEWTWVLLPLALAVALGALEFSDDWPPRSHRRGRFAPLWGVAGVPVRSCPSPPRARWGCRPAR